MKKSPIQISFMTPNKITQLLLLLGIMFYFSACKDDEVLFPENYNQLTPFYPIDSGFWIEYSVDSTIHLNIDDQYLVDTSIDAHHFNLREQIDSSFVDGEGKIAWMVSRYKRDADSLPWLFTSMWTARLSSTSLERVEDNQRYIRLTFPLKSGRTWNGNAYNLLGEAVYKYEDVYSPKMYSALNFDSTVVVNQDDFVSNISRSVKEEVYGNHIGLLYKSIDSVRVAATPGGIIILNGLEYKQTITNYKH